MDFFKKKHDLEKLINQYLKNEVRANVLQNFAWDMIDYFNKTKKSELPNMQSFEKEFWYAIWQIQHLTDEEHEKDNITRKALSEALEYLEKRKKIPENFSGTRP